MKGGEMWRKTEVHFGWGLRLGLVQLLLAVYCGSLFIVHAAEPVAQIPLGEFKVMLSNVDRLQKREQLYIEKDKLAAEKDRLQTDYIAKMEAADEQRERYVEKLEVLANDPRWADRATWAGYGAAVPIVVQVVRKFILKL